MKCIHCGGAMSTRRESAPYASLAGVVLVDVAVSRCPGCGEHETAIPAIDELDRAIARAVIRKRTRLLGPEIRFLRSHLGYSAAAFARLIGSDPATVSRWEGDKQAVGHHMDRLVRAMVALAGKDDEYSIAMIARVDSKVTERPLYAFRFVARAWRSAARSGASARRGPPRSLPAGPQLPSCKRRSSRSRRFPRRAGTRRR